jgi:TrmH family RNA methyltransferase
MLSKNKIKFINSLKKKKNRINKRLFIAEGEKIIYELFISSFRIAEFFATEDFISQLSEEKKSSLPSLHEITESELKKISDLKTPNKALALVEIPNRTIDTEETQNSLSLVLDKINDPGNLGTIIRTADWFGINQIFCSNGSVDLYNPKVIQSTMGSFTRVKLFYQNLTELLEKYNEIDDFRIYGTFLEGDNIYRSQLSDKGLIIMGSESHGISDNLKEFIHQKLYIPSFTSVKNIEQSESLNISVATGIVCSEFRRRKDVSTDRQIQK